MHVRLFVVALLLSLFLPCFGQEPHTAPVTQCSVELVTPAPGVDLSAYTASLRDRIAHNWQVPAEARAPKFATAVISINFILKRDGKLTQVKVKQADGNVKLGRAAYGALLASKPYPPLPDTFSGPELKFRAQFLYNPK